jgi:hypothetical protein
MKKYMILALFVFYQSHAMEVEIEPCYLATMPCDILDLIASFLMETEEQFVARTRVINKKLFATEDCVTFLENYGFHYARGALCPDETKALLFIRKQLLLDDGRCNYLDNMVIIDRKENNDDKKIIYQRELDNVETYDDIALSNGGSMIAMFHQEKECYEGEDCTYDIFEIQKIATQKKREICMFGISDPKIIAFNKQGTHFIAHGKDPITKEAIHKIFPLKRVDPNKQQIVVKPTNKLQEYFRDKFVCNQCIEGKK